MLSGSEAHHLARVRRIGAGETVTLFDGAGTRACGRVLNIGPQSVEIEVETLETLPARRQGRIVIAASIAKGERFEWLISKCTELGVDRIYPVWFERTVKKTNPEKAVLRYEKLALAAAKQSGRLFLPQIDNPSPLPAVADRLKADHRHAYWLLGSLSPQAPSLANRTPSESDVLVFVGPEGGMTQAEEELLNRCGARAVRLTDTILRVETAAITFAALLTAQRQAQERISFDLTDEPH